jgi:hypothetical protein
MIDNTGRALDQEAEKDGAYVRNGVSKFTRDAARTRQQKKLVSNRSLTVTQMIDHHERKLRELRQRLNHGPVMDEQQVAQLLRHIDAKEHFIEKLWLELGERK